MKIAFCVEGSADRAMVQGLRDRWCPQADLLEGRFRGQLPRSQIPKECRILTSKGADLIVFLRDANEENWRHVVRADEARCPAEYRHLVVFGVCDRNAECWLAADANHLAAHVERPSAEFVAEDPSPVVKAAFGLVGFGKHEQEPRVAAYVATAPLGRWLGNRSFEHFYDQLWQKSKEMDCPRMENLRERSA